VVDPLKKIKIKKDGNKKESNKESYKKSWQEKIAI
jgi:hypothetical protein